MSTVQRTLFSQDSVKQLRETDFVNLESETKININYKECMLVLFYGDNLESSNLVSIWATAAKNTVGPVFAAVNLMAEPRIAAAFTSLNMQNGALHWAALKTIPFILVYQNGWPIAFYNGERSVQSIIDYSLTLACKAEYHEPFNLFGGMVISNNQNLTMKGDTQYGIPANPLRRDSLAFSANENVRGYDRTDTVTQFGSAAEGAASRHVLANEQASRVGLPQSVIPVTAVPTETGTTETGELEAPPGTAEGLLGQAATPSGTEGVAEGVAEPTEQALAGGVRVTPPTVGGERVAEPTEMEPPPGSSLE